MRKFFAEHKVISVLAMLDVLVVALLVVLFVNKQQETAMLDVLVTPASATILLDGKSLSNSNSYKVKPGEYTVTISSDGFETKVLEINAEADKTTKVYAYLTGENNDFSWYETNIAALDTLKQVGQDAAAQAFLEKMSILDILPYNYVALDEGSEQSTQFAVEIDRIDCPETFCLQAVNKYNSTNELIKTTMMKEGYNLDDYTVYYY